MFDGSSRNEFVMPITFQLFANNEKILLCIKKSNTINSDKKNGCVLRNKEILFT